MNLKSKFKFKLINQIPIYEDCIFDTDAVSTGTHDIAFSGTDYPTDTARFQ